jgi:hypothetical protein
MNFLVLLEQPWFLRVDEHLVLNFTVPFSHHIYKISQYLIVTGFFFNLSTELILSLFG